MRLVLVCAVSLLLAAGCAPGPRLTPAPEAQHVIDLEQAAYADVAGVRTIVRGGAWPGEPVALPQLTPLEISIENHGDRPLRIRYHQFALVDPTGHRYAALPPYQVEGTAVIPGPMARPTFPYAGFGFAPHYGPGALGLPGWYGAFPHDPLDTGRYQGLWQARLPTQGMLERALLEGVVSPGGYVHSGFLYFEAVDEDLPRVDFRFELVDASTGEPFGTIRIPFTSGGS